MPLIERSPLTFVRGCTVQDGAGKAVPVTQLLRAAAPRSFDRLLPVYIVYSVCYVADDVRPFTMHRVQSHVGKAQRSIVFHAKLRSTPSVGVTPLAVKTVSNTPRILWYECSVAG